MSTTENGQRNGNGALSWKILTTLAAIASMATVIFFAGGAWQKASTTTEDFKTFAKEADERFIRKDGKEFEALTQQVRRLTERIDDLTTELKSQRLPK